MHEDVIGFDIPMHDVTARQNLEGFHDLLEIEERSLLGQGALLLHEFVQSSAIAVFIDKVEVVGCFEHIDVFDDVGAALQRGEDVDFVDCALLQLGDLLELLRLHHLDRHLQFRDQVHCLVDLRVDSFSQLLLELVVFDDFTHSSKFYYTQLNPQAATKLRTILADISRSSNSAKSRGIELNCSERARGMEKMGDFQSGFHT
jgi:hypothetical protein